MSNVLEQKVIVKNFPKFINMHIGLLLPRNKYMFGCLGFFCITELLALLHEQRLKMMQKTITERRKKHNDKQKMVDKGKTSL